MDWWLPLSFFLIALLYSNAGFGGGSSYLALLAMTSATTDEIRTTALVCNVVVVAIGSAQFYRKGILSLKRILPLIALSVPAAFLGAMVRLEERTFFLILGAVLLLAAAAMILQTAIRSQSGDGRTWHWSVRSVVGGGAGFLSGLVGIGGGIFLSPILHFSRWANPRVIAAAASAFILVNSLAGLGGRMVDHSFSLVPSWFWLVLLVMMGGWLGNRSALKLGHPNRIRWITAVLIAAVGIRLLLKFV